MLGGVFVCVRFFETDSTNKAVMIQIIVNSLFRASPTHFLILESLYCLTELCFQFRTLVFIFSLHLQTASHHVSAFHTAKVVSAIFCFGKVMPSVSKKFSSLSGSNFFTKTLQSKSLLLFMQYKRRNDRDDGNESLKKKIQRVKLNLKRLTPEESKNKKNLKN